MALRVGHSELAFSAGICRIWHWSLVAWTAVSREMTLVMWRDDCVRWRRFLSFWIFVSRTRFRVLSTMGDLFTYGKLCPFLTLVCESWLNLLFWPRIFTRLSCVILVGLGYLPFLIKAVTLFFADWLFKCSSWLCPRQGVAYFIFVCLSFMGPFWGI